MEDARDVYFTLSAHEAQAAQGRPLHAAHRRAPAAALKKNEKGTPERRLLTLEGDPPASTKRRQSGPSTS